MLVHSEEEFYKIACEYWAINENRIPEINTICVCYNGTIRKVYKDLSWEFKFKDNIGRANWKFKGEPHNDSPYLNKKLNFSFQGAASGIRYGF